LYSRKDGLRREDQIRVIRVHSCDSAVPFLAAAETNSNSQAF